MLAQAQTLAEDFGRMVRQRGQQTGGELERWLAVAAAREIPELVSCVNGVRRDYDAVAAAFVSEWSQGQTEGQVNRLKLLNSSTYRRAKLDLLRQRLLYPSV
jgi:transposase